MSHSASSSAWAGVTDGADFVANLFFRRDVSGADNGVPGVEGCGMGKKILI